MSLTTLYRKYRPASFAEVKGQDHVISVIKSAVLKGNFPQGYLFTGPRGTGKTTSARLLAKAINCLRFVEMGDVCNECENCLLINKTEGTDIIEMDAASNRGIEEIRVLRETVQYLPTFLKYKVYIIDEAHMLTKEAFNALLKTLEEPPAHVIFILATTEPNKIPVTVQSRLVRFDFRLVDKNYLNEKIEKIVKSEGINLEADALEIIHRLSGGSFRDAESILGQLYSQTSDITSSLVQKVFGVASQDTIQNFVNALRSKDLESLVQIISELQQTSIDLEVFLSELMTYVVNNNESSQEVINLVVLLGKLSRSINRYSNPYSYIKLKLMQYVKGFEKSSQQQTPSSATTKKEGSKIYTTNEDKSEFETQKPVLGQLEFNIHKIVENFEDKRLAAILRTCEIVLKSSKVIITSGFMFNVKFISKPENIAIIAESLKSTHPQVDFTDIQVVKGDVYSLPTQDLANLEKEDINNVSFNKDNSKTVEEVFGI